MPITGNCDDKFKKAVAEEYLVILYLNGGAGFIDKAGVIRESGRRLPY